MRVPFGSCLLSSNELDLKSRMNVDSNIYTKEFHMKDLVAMRHKYWSEEKSLWPAKKSNVAVPFCWEGFKINVCCLEMAQEMARQGKFNVANYLLTAAYAVGARNDDFWNQFI